MNWKELIERLTEGRGVKLISTATTGLKEEEDELLAVSVLSPSVEGSTLHTYVKRIEDRNKVLKSQEYHKISPEASMEGLAADDFVNAVNTELGEAALFTYNPSFHSKFLEKQGIEKTLYSLPLLYKAADTRMGIPESDTNNLGTLYATCVRNAGGVKSFTKTAAELGVTPTYLELPLQFSCRVLLLLWEALERIPVMVFEETFR